MRFSIRPLAVASAVLFLVLLAISIATGVSQQWFESAHEPSLYLEQLVRSSAALRLEIAIDDVFIVAYVGVAVAIAARLPRTAIAQVITVSVLLAGALDYLENHHILAMLRAAPALPELAELKLQMTLSMSKWVLGHAVFVLLALHLRPRTALDRAVQWSMLFVQMPVGVLVWTHPSAFVFWARALNLFAGFVYLAARGDELSVETGARE